MVTRRLVVQLTTDVPERVASALTVGMAAAAAGAQVDLWLSGPATLLVVPGREPPYDVEFAPTLEDALSAMSSVAVCSQCAARRRLVAEDLRTGARIAGATELVEVLLTDAVQAVSY